MTPIVRCGDTVRRRRNLDDPGRFLQKRNGVYHYKRRVPADLIGLDPRAPHIRISLKTRDLAHAMAQRDLLEAADNELWGSIIVDGETDDARQRYQAAVRRAAAMGFSYRTAAEIAAEPIGTIVKRIEAIMSPQTSPQTVAAVAGTVEKPHETVSGALDLYFSEIAADQLRLKSEEQRRRWKNKRRQSVNTFISLVGDKPMHEITRDDARELYKFWVARIAPERGPPTHTPSSGNRDLSNMKILYEAYFATVGEDDRKNPFVGLSFRDPKIRRRPSVSAEWIGNVLFKPGALVGLNDEARGVLLAMTETGARPGELCNLRQDYIHLSAEVPHIRIEPRDDPNDPREIKTHSSIRQVPLVGIALEVFRKHPNGFPRYRDNETTLSNTLNKYLREKKLWSSPKQTVYSVRHGFEDRMKEGGLDEELRRILMGHSIDRPRYGIGGSLGWRRDELLKIALPFDPVIV